MSDRDSTVIRFLRTMANDTQRRHAAAFIRQYVQHRRVNAFHPLCQFFTDTTATSLTDYAERYGTPAARDLLEKAIYVESY